MCARWILFHRWPNLLLNPPPEQLAAGIVEKERRIAEIMGRIQGLLARK
jgi:hypothetical protein